MGAKGDLVRRRVVGLLAGGIASLGFRRLTDARSTSPAQHVGEVRFDGLGRRIDPRPLPSKEAGRFVMAYLRTMQGRFRRRNQRYGHLPEIWHDPLRNWTPIWLSDASFLEQETSEAIAPGSRLHRLTPDWDVVFELSDDSRHFKILVVSTSNTEVTHYAYYNVDNTTVYEGTCVGRDHSTFSGTPVW